VTLSDYLRVAAERWKIVLAGLILGLAGASAATWAIPPEYTTKSTVYLASRTSNDSLASAFQGGMLSAQRVKTYTALMTSTRVAQDIATDLHADHLTPAAIAASLKVTVQPDTVLLTMSATHRSPEVAQRIADAAGRAFSRVVEQMEKPSDPAREPVVTARILEPALLPTTPTQPRPTLNFLIGSVFGLLAGYAGALIRSALDTSVKSAEDLGKITDAPNLGEIAFDPKVPQRPLTVHEHPHSARAEAFRQLRTNLQFVDVDRPRKLIVVTSSMPKEGKSTTLCNLAITLAKAGSRVVVVEADLRLPRVADYLGLNGAIGVTNVLAGQLALEDALQTWGRNLFHVLPSGPLPANPSELLGSQQMANLLAELGKRYDMVLVDSPPLLPVTDAAAVSTACDGAIMIVRHGKTTRNQIKSAKAALEAVSVRLLGTVMTMTPNPGTTYSYYPYQSANEAKRLASVLAKPDSRLSSKNESSPAEGGNAETIRHEHADEEKGAGDGNLARTVLPSYQEGPISRRLETEHVLQENPRNHVT
jgi:capsular exopolysaccharide synthesis family protein